MYGKVLFKMSKALSRNKRELLKEKCLEYLGGKVCFKCKISSLPVVCYDFHHCSGDKEFDISKYSKWDEKIRKELDKCIILCKNCHGVVHYMNTKINKKR